MPADAAPRRRTRVLALAEARWAAAALALFLIALPLQLTGAAPAWAWGPLYALVYATGGWEPGWAGLRALKDRTLDVDLLMIAAALGAAAIGQVMDGALLIVIFAVSGALEALATARTQDAVRGLLDLAPATATLVGDDGTETTVVTARLAVGDTVLVRPGERVGADGRVLDGASEVDQATITGEPLPVAKQAGDEVFAGTLNGTGALRVKVERDPADSVIARIVAMVEEASRTKAPTQLFIEKVEQRYSLGMVAATLAVFAVPLAFGAALTGALLRAMTFMIVASPCAVVLATMPPLLSAIATAGRHGVLIKSAVVMERLGQVDAVALDKTGTLTEGTPHVTAVHPLTGSAREASPAAPGAGAAAPGEDAAAPGEDAAAPGEDGSARDAGAAALGSGVAAPGADGSALGSGVATPGAGDAAGPDAAGANAAAPDTGGGAATTPGAEPLRGDLPDADALLALAAAAEHASEHPLGRAVVAAARDRGLVLPAATGFSSAPGIGVTATVDGSTVTVGAPARLPAASPADPAAARAATIAAELEDGGHTAVLVRRDGRPVGVLGIADRLRPDAAATVAALARLTGAESAHPARTDAARRDPTGSVRPAPADPADPARTAAAAQDRGGPARKGTAAPVPAAPAAGPVLLTGDNPRAAARLAAEVGIGDVRAGLLPQDKVDAVRALEASGRKVLVIGDGVNDAPALAAAHTGIAMGRAGSDLALETADAVVVRDELATVPAAVALSRRARRLVVQNLVVAGVFITGLVVWDLAGHLPLPLGVAGHEGSTVLVGLNGLRLLADRAWRRARTAA